MAPASDLRGLIGNLDQIPGGSIFASYVIAAYTQIYPDVKENDVLRPAARAFVDEMAQRCLAEPETLVSVGSSLTFDGPIFKDTAGFTFHGLRHSFVAILVAAGCNVREV